MIDDDENLLWKLVFLLQTKQNCRDSLVWHKYAPGLECVHRRGCAMKVSERRTYKGALSAKVGKITSYRNQNGHGLFVEHVPKGGYWHAEVGYDINNEKPFNKPDKTELEFLLKKVFGGSFSEYSCVPGRRIIKLARRTYCDLLARDLCRKIRRSLPPSAKRTSGI